MPLSALVKQPIIISIFDVLIKEKKDKVFLVGGVVRDFIINSSLSRDIDIATNMLPEVVLERLSRVSGGKVLTNAMSYGSVSLFIDSYAVTVTTFRKDVETFGRSAVVESVDDVEVDAGRRDFTINALYVEANGNLLDFFGGLDDIAKKLVKFIGDPSSRIQEDYLRVLRFFRFSCMFTEVYDRHAIMAIVSNLDGIAKVSKERITFELRKILESKFAVAGLQVMQDIGVCSAVFGAGVEISISAFRKAHYVFCTETKELSHDPFLTLAVSMKDDHIDLLKKKVCLSKKELETIELYQKNRNLVNTRSMNDEQKADLIESFLKNSSVKKLVLFNPICSAEMIHVLNSYVKMPFGGLDVLKLLPEIRKSMIRQLLAHLHRLWISSQYQMSYSDLSRCMLGFYATISA